MRITFGFIAKSVRTNYGYSQKKMGNVLNKDTRTIRNYEKDRTTPTCEVLNWYLREFKKRLD